VKVDRSVKEKYPIVKFEECLKIVSSYVNEKVDKPKELNKKTIGAFSYYYDRATEYGLIGKCYCYCYCYCYNAVECSELLLKKILLNVIMQ
jgi:hypothetical protein